MALESGIYQRDPVRANPQQWLARIVQGRPAELMDRKM